MGELRALGARAGWMLYPKGMTQQGTPTLRAATAVPFFVGRFAYRQLASDHLPSNGKVDGNNPRVRFRGFQLVHTPKQERKIAMVESTNPPTDDTKGKREARPIFVDAAGYADILSETKNRTLPLRVHPEFAVTIYKMVAALPDATITADGRVELKRPRLTDYLIDTLATALNYGGAKAIQGRRGGISATSVLTNMVLALFGQARAMGARFNISDEEVRNEAFENVREAIAGDTNLAGLTISDAVLESLWNGEEELEEVDDEEEEEEE